MLSVFRHGTRTDRALGRGAGVAFAAQVSAVGLGYVAHVFLARWMGVTEYGAYVYALGWAVPLATLSGLGIHMAALRFVPTYVGSQVYGKVRGSYRAGSALTFTSGIVVAAAALALVALLGSAVPATIRWSLVVGIAIVPLLSITHFNASYLKALKRVGRAGLSDVVRPPLLLACAAALLLTTGSVTAPNLLLALGGTLLVVGVLQYVLVRLSLPEPAKTARAETDFPAWRAAVGAMLLIEVFQALMVKADVLLLGAMIGVDAVAIFGVAARVAGLVGFVVSAVATMAGPMFTELHSRGEKSELQRLVRTAGKWIFWPSLIVAALVALFAPFVLGLFGRDFVDGSSVLWILLVAQMGHAVAGPVFVLITFTGFQEQSARIYGAMLVLNVTLNIVGIQLVGIHGAAIAALITVVAWTILLNRAVSTHLGIQASLLSSLFSDDK